MIEVDAASALRDAMWLSLKLGGPLLIGALAVGLVISLLQAITQISEPTLVFLPKVAITGVALFLLGPFMTSQLTEFAQRMMERMISVGGL